MSDLKQIITRKTLREEAGSTYFGRGLDYFKSGYVKKLEVHGNRIEGSVRGSRLYHCSIECDIDADSLFGECSCPLGDDGEFCKHLVALGLAFINGFETPAPSRKQPDFKLAKFLRERSREELVALLNGASKQYPDLLEYFRMSYLPAASEALQKELTLKIDRLLELAEECDYEDCYDYDEQYKIEQDEERLRQELKQLTDTMERMFSGTHAAMVMELAEYAIKEAVRRDLQSEDSCAGLISEMLSFYFKAVKKGLGKAADVAENMIEWEPLDSWGAMSQVGRYFMDAPARIEKAWNTAALHLWRKMPVLGMKDQRMTSTQRAIIEKRLLQYARINSDSELELEILQHNQSTEEHVLALGKLLIRLNRREELPDYLREAFRHFPHSCDIRQSLVEELVHVKKYSEAMEIAWRYFEENPNCSGGYQFLRSAARSSRQGGEFLEKALAYVETYFEKNQDGIASRSTRIDILICEKEYGRALEIAESGLCSHDSLFRLASALSKTQPDASARLVKRPLEQFLKEAGDKFYEKSVAALKLYRQYLVAAGHPEQFQAECLAIREQQKKRRKFIALLDQAKL